MIYLKDPSGKPSVTLTVFLLTVGVALVKLLFSGVTLGGFTLSPFTGGDFAASIGAAGAIYFARRNVGNRKDG